MAKQKLATLTTPNGDTSGLRGTKAESGVVTDVRNASARSDVAASTSLEFEGRPTQSRCLTVQFGDDSSLSSSRIIGTSEPNNPIVYDVVLHRCVQVAGCQNNSNTETSGWPEPRAENRNHSEHRS